MSQYEHDLECTMDWTWMTLDVDLRNGDVDSVDMDLALMAEDQEMADTEWYRQIIFEGIDIASVSEMVWWTHLQDRGT